MREHRFIRLEGFEELDKQLRQLTNDFKNDTAVKATLVKSLQIAAQPVEQTAYSLAAYDYNRKSEVDKDGNKKPHMRDTIKTIVRIPTESDLRSENVFDSDAVIAVVSVKKSAVSKANEFGTAKMQAKPFLRPALERNVKTVTNILKSELGEWMDAYARKLSKKGKR